MTAALLSVRGLMVQAGSQRILEDVSFELGHGRILGLFGDSGAGKSTLLHAVSGLEGPGLRVRGQIHLNGQPIQHTPPEVRSHLGIGIVLQNLGLFDDRTVFENIAYPLRRRKNATDEVTAKVEETLEFLRLSQFRTRYPQELSGGQRQRVALARAIIYQPVLLLLDEPLRGLEEALRLEFLAYLRAVAGRGTALVLVTHERQELQLVADELITLKAGRATPKELPGKQGFDGLQSVYSMPVPSNGDVVRLANLCLVKPGQETPHSIEVHIHSWRALGPARRAALVTHRNGAPGWLIFENVTENPSTLPVGDIQVAGTQKG